MQVRAPLEDRYDEALTDGALALVGRLHEELDARRHELLDARQELQARLDAGESLDFVTAPSDFRVAPVPEALQDRRVEITGPTSRKMVINALNSGARGFMADFEDSNSPYWSNMVEGQVNLADAIRGSIEHDEKGKHYELGDEPAVLHVRPRGLHLPERHVVVGGEPVAGAFMDFGLYVHRNTEALLERGWGPYFYIPKLESHREAALWRDAFVIAEETLGLERGTIKATVLIETIPAAFEMDAILYELRDHAAGLNAGRWDYIFSVIKRFRSRAEFVTPDRSDVTMTVPFMKAYSDLVVKTCHARGAHAMGGMAAGIPSPTHEEAHPKAFDEVLGDRSNQVDRRRDDVSASVAALLDVASTPGSRTEEGLRSNVNVGIQYISSWLRGNGAAGIYGLMEDAATAELARELATSELERIRSEIGDDQWFEKEGRPDLSRSLFERVALSDDFIEFLTLPAYDELLQLEH